VRAHWHGHSDPLFPVARTRHALRLLLGHQRQSRPE
jgi:hypothetical protein